MNEQEQRAARKIARDTGRIGIESDTIPTRRERLALMAEVCRGINPADLESIRQAGSGVVAVLKNGTTAKFGCW